MLNLWRGLALTINKTFVVTATHETKEATKPTRETTKSKRETTTSTQVLVTDVKRSALRTPPVKLWQRTTQVFVFSSSDVTSTMAHVTSSSSCRSTCWMEYRHMCEANHACWLQRRTTLHPEGNI